ncbi:MAG: PAS domain S-box protein [Deltaproteobacteria bacterium]|nr:PAS domain S-box protein [Deltaproteobacteria bacterium]
MRAREKSPQEKIWIEVIHTMEKLYANLAQAQTGMEQKAEELLLANEFSNNIIRSMVNALVVSDSEGRVTAVNDSCLKALGCRERDLVGRPLKSLFADEAHNALYPGSRLWRQLTEAGVVRDAETELRAVDGASIPVSLNASIMLDRAGEISGVVLVANDLREVKRLLEKARSEAKELDRAYRELKALQARLIQSEKMSSLGRMAASVAHEINNPLGAIMVYTHLVLEELAAESEHGKILSKVVREVTRCKEIVQGLLGLSRTQQGKRKTLDFNEIVTATFDLLRGQPLFCELEHELRIAPQPVLVDGEEGPLKQAVMNVMVNAAEAMNGRGKLGIRTWTDPDARTAGVAISDTGVGIPKESLDKLYEPFYTTKETGHGTGLGLAITYGIVRRHGGTMEVESRLEQGTTFTLSFPSQSKAPGAEEAV